MSALLPPIMHNGGIYAIRNIQNGREYIGVAHMAFSYRWNAHRSLLRRGKHHCKLLQADWTTHGETAFEFVLLEVMPVREINKNGVGLMYRREGEWYRQRLAEGIHLYNSQNIL